MRAFVVRVVAAVSSATLLIPVGAAADDKDSCQNGKDRALVISACSRLLQGTFATKKDRAETLHQRGFAYLQTQDYEASIKDYSEALRTYPPYAHYYYAWRVRAFEESGQFAKAVEDRNALIKLHPKESSYIRDRGRTYRRMGDWDRALSDFTRAIEMDSNNPAGYRERASFYADKGEYAKANDELSHAIRLDPKDGFAHVKRAINLIRLGDLDRALEEYGRAIATAPEYPVFYQYRAELSQHMRNHERAFADLTTAVRLDTKSTGALRARARAYLRRDDHVLALNDFTQAVSREPDSPYVYIDRAKAYQAQGRWEQAYDDYKSALALKAEEYTYRVRAEAFAKQGDWDHALRDCASIIELWPNGPGGYAARAKILAAQGNWVRALEDAEQWVRHAPMDSTALSFRGTANLNLGNIDAASRDIERAVFIQPTSNRALLSRGALLEKQDQSQKAIADYKRVLAMHAIHDQERDEQSEARTRLHALGVSLPGSPTAIGTAPVTTSKPIAPASEPQAASATDTRTSRRIALIVGNSQYKNVAGLPNPGRDASALARAFRDVGFSAVTLATDLAREGFINSLRQFSADADDADWAVVYFAGHGIEVGGINYLLPVDARLVADRDAQLEGIPLHQVLAAIEGARKLRLVLLDACRDNPFVRHMRRTTASRSVGRGLARIEPAGGTLVAYAARDGQIALDGDGDHSPFAAAFLRLVKVPGLEINKLFRLLRDDVMDATSNRQEPYTYGALPGREDHYFLAR